MSSDRDGYEHTFHSFISELADCAAFCNAEKLDSASAEKPSVLVQQSMAKPIVRSVSLMEPATASSPGKEIALGSMSRKDGTTGRDSRANSGGPKRISFTPTQSPWRQ